VVGRVQDIGSSSAAAWRQVAALGLDLASNERKRDLTFAELASHYQQQELHRESGIRRRVPETVVTHELVLRRWILPRWGGIPASEIRPLAIEEWFESLTSQPVEGKGRPLQWPTIVKIKGIMSQVFQHGQRHELIPAIIGADGRPSNPVLLARTKSESSYEAIVVSPEQMIYILGELDTDDTRLEWMAALLHAVTGLRPEEAFGLQWWDVA
jgi:integrase